MSVICVEIPGVVKAVNAISRSTHWPASTIRKYWRETAYSVAKYTRTPKVADADYPVTVHVYETYTSRGIKDSGSNFEVSKGAVDGLVAAGIMVDDGPRYVSCTALHAPVKGSKDVLTIELVPDAQGRTNTV